MAGLSFGRLLGGTIIVESIFALPGMGTLLVNGINGRDYPVVQGAVLVYASLFILVNLIADLVYTRVDPRVRYESKRRDTERSGPCGASIRTISFKLPLPAISQTTP